MNLQNAFTIPFYLPRIYRLFSNWPLYLSNYLFRRKSPAVYCLRSGLRLIDATGTLAGTIAVVFIRREYGDVQDAQTIVDIGANMGCFTIYAAAQAPNARIVSIEPEAKNFDVLKRNIEVNSLHSRVTAQMLAVAGSVGQRSIAVDESPLHTLLQVSEGGPRQAVDCIDMAGLFEKSQMESIDFLKMNCEGAEYEIVENCPMEVFQRIRKIRLEYHDIDSDKKNGRSLARSLQQRGFSIERFTTYREHGGIFPESGFIWVSRSTSGNT